MSEGAIDSGAQVKVESDDEVENYHGSYVCLICFDSVRGQPALHCVRCNCPPWYVACDKDKKYIDNCPQYEAIGYVRAFTAANFWTAAPSAMIDLTGEGGGGAAVATLAEGGEVWEEAAPEMGGAVVAADVVWQGGASALHECAGVSGSSAGGGGEAGGCAGRARRCRQRKQRRGQGACGG